MNPNKSPFRYVPWFMRDLAIWPGSLFLLASVGLAFAIRKVSRSFMGDISITEAQEAVTMIQGQTFHAILLVAVLMAMGGVIGTDQHRGWYRAWFSKPIAPWWYYLQRFLLAAVLVLMMPLVFGLGLSLFTTGGTGITSALLGIIALGFLLYGSAVMLASVFTSRDWLIVFIVAFFQNQVATFSRMGLIKPPPWMRVLHDALPPTHLIDTTGPMLSGNALLHVAGYGVAMLLAALLLLKYRPLGSGGRA